MFFKILIHPKIFEFKVVFLKFLSTKVLLYVFTRVYLRKPWKIHS